MKKILSILLCGLLITNMVMAQNEDKDSKPVRSPFESGVLLENQTNVLPSPNTLEWVIQHRFGKINNGLTDLFGIYAPSNIRLGFNYTFNDWAQIGFGTTKNNNLQDLNLKLCLLKQTRSNSMPIALTYYGNVVLDARAAENFDKPSHRISYHHQLMITRKFSRMLTLQLTGSFAHYNVVDTLYKHDHLTVSLLGRVKVSSQLSIVFEYDQPITQPEAGGDFAYPKSNLSLGIEIATSSHSFQVFLGSYDAIINQRNNVFNPNDFTAGEMLLGFNITRLWNF